jgi:glycosyltransferase involved in cell wall biosynthesis
MKRSVGIFYFSCISYDYALLQRPQQLFNAWTEREQVPFDFFYVDFPDYFIKTLDSFGNFVKRRYRSLIAEAHSTQARKKRDKRNIVTGWFYLPLEQIGSSLLERLSVFDKINRPIINGFFMHRLFSAGAASFDNKVAIVAHPSWEPFVSKQNFDVICYDYLDEIGVFSNYRSYDTVRHLQERLIEKSDIVFVITEAMKERVRAVANQKEVITVSNGVNVDFFQENKSATQISDYQKRNHKTVGYVGSFYKWVDMDLIYDAAESLQSADFVLVGPAEALDTKYVNSKPNNVFLLGTKDYKQVPAYIELFDVGLIPFKKDQIGDYADPIKLYEYFSLGKPVVATSLEQLQRFSGGNKMITAQTTQEFVDAIKFFLINDNEMWREARKEVARTGSWSNQAGKMLNGIKNRL